MRKAANLLIFLMFTLSLQPIIADSVAPNGENTQTGEIISIDAFITTKFTSVGDTIEIFANTKATQGLYRQHPQL